MRPLLHRRGSPCSCARHAAVGGTGRTARDGRGGRGHARPRSRAEARTADTLGRQRSGSGVVIDVGGPRPDHRLPDPRGVRRSTSTTAGRQAHTGRRSWATTTRPASGWCAPACRWTWHRCRSATAARSRSATAAGAQPRRPARRARGQARQPARVRRLLGVPAARRPVHDTAAPDFAGAALIDPRGPAGRHRLAGRRRRHAPRTSPRPATCSCPSTRCSRSWPTSWRSATATRRRIPGSASPPRSMPATLIVRSVADGGPAERGRGPPGRCRAGGRAAPQVASLAELYRAIWSLGDPGVPVPLRVMRDNRIARAQRAVDRPAALAAPQPDLLARPQNSSTGSDHPDSARLSWPSAWSIAAGRPSAGPAMEHCSLEAAGLREEERQFTAAIAWLWLRERPSPRTMAASGLALLGIVVMLGPAAAGHVRATCWPWRRPPRWRC